MSQLLEQIPSLLFLKDPFALLFSAVDILIVAWIIYRLILLIRGTRAAYTLTGLLVVAGIFLGAHQLALSTLTWLLDNLINYIILIIIIVFQADIRRGLMRVGHRIFTTSTVTDDLTVIDQAVAACETMSRAHVGALIVFERDVDLSEIVEPGTPIEARVTRELLCNIFAPWPENALHDGAVLIKGSRIQQSGVVLPLSRNSSLDKALGTRHRAALGITEETDAVAIVVSEQRGTISLAAAGLLHMSLPPPILKAELLARMTLEEKSRVPWLERLLTKSQAVFGATGAIPPPETYASRAARVTGPLQSVSSSRLATGPLPIISSPPPAIVDASTPATPAAASPAVVAPSPSRSEGSTPEPKAARTGKP